MCMKTALVVSVPNRGLWPYEHQQLEESEEETVKKKLHDISSVITKKQLPRAAGFGDEHNYCSLRRKNIYGTSIV